MCIRDSRPAQPDVVPLPHSDAEGIGVHRLNREAVTVGDCHPVTAEREPEGCVRTRINDSDADPLARFGGECGWDSRRAARAIDPVVEYDDPFIVVLTRLDGILGDPRDANGRTGQAPACQPFQAKQAGRAGGTDQQSTAVDIGQRTSPLYLSVLSQTQRTGRRTFWRA